MLTELIAGRIDLAGLTLPTPDQGRVRVRAGARFSRSTATGAPS
ncbi:hypothetical protein [Aeromicrobium sp. UC242_57]